MNQTQEKHPLVLALRSALIASETRNYKDENILVRTYVREELASGSEQVTGGDTVPVPVCEVTVLFETLIEATDDLRDDLINMVESVINVGAQDFVLSHLAFSYDLYSEGIDEYCSTLGYAE